MANYLAVLSLVCIVGLGCALTTSPAITTCDQLPKLTVAENHHFANSGPLPYEYSLTSLFDCATQIWTHPKRGSKGHRGTSPLIQGDKVNVYQYTLGSDNKTIHSTVCSTGISSVWYLAAAKLDADGTFYCIYSCNGTALAEYGCVSNNDKYLPEQKAAVDVARGVPNGEKIHRAQENCPNHGCTGFN